MPRLNRYAQVATDPQGRALWRWRTDDEAIGQQAVTPGTEGDPRAPYVMAARPRGREGYGVPFTRGIGGCNVLAAGGGRWMRRLDGPVPQLTGSEAWHPAADGRVGDIDRDGRAVTLSEDQLVIYDHDGPEHRTIRRAGVEGDTRFMHGLLAWTWRGRVCVYDADGEGLLDVRQAGPGASKAVAFRAQRRRWVLYQTDATGGLLHPIDDASQGYRFGPSPIRPGTEGIFDPDVLVTDDGEAVIVWAAREGQLQEDIRWHLTPVLGQGMVSLTGVETTAPIVPINRELWFGFFEFAGPVACDTANCRVPVTQGAPWLEVRDLQTGGVRYRYVSGDPDGDPDAIDRAVARAAGAGVDVLAYVPRRAAAIRLPDAIIGVECYRRADESVEDFERSIRALVARCPRSVLIAQCYTSNTTLTTDLRSIPPVIARVARDCANVEAILVFSGSGRATGFQDHPSVQPDWRALGATIQAPQARPVPPTAPLAITITEYREQGQVPMALYALYRVTGHGDQPVSVALTLDGARVSGSNATAGRLEVELHEPGEYRLGATVRCGDRVAETGAVRIVRVLPAPVEPPTVPPVPPYQPPAITPAGTPEAAAAPWRDAADLAARRNGD